mgnify:CR=1 FL=1
MQDKKTAEVIARSPINSVLHSTLHDTSQLNSKFKGLKFRINIKVCGGLIKPAQQLSFFNKAFADSESITHKRNSRARIQDNNNLKSKSQLPKEEGRGE